jgi:hypothetical protein
MLSTSIRVRPRVVLRWPPGSAFVRDPYVPLGSRNLSRTALATSSCAHQTSRRWQFKTPTNSRYLIPCPIRSLAASQFARHSTMSTVANPPVELEHDQYRLPTNIKATHYDVTIKTDLESLTFEGFVKIRYAG